LKEFLEQIKEQLRLNRPSIDSSDKGVLYIPHPPALEKAHHFKLDLTFKDLVDNGHISGKPTEQF